MKKIELTEGRLAQLIALLIFAKNGRSIVWNEDYEDILARIKESA